MGIRIAYHGYNNPVYHVRKNVGVHYTRQNIVFGSDKKQVLGTK